jgi:hypothetical protein
VSAKESEEPRPKVGASSKEKALRLVGSRPKPSLTFHPRAKHGALWLFHVSLRVPSFFVWVTGAVQGSLLKAILKKPNSPISASCCSAESFFQQNSLDEFPTGGREFITALRRP